MLNDLWSSLKFWRIWFFLSYAEIRTDYRHTFLGPCWSMINVFFFAIPVCILYKNIFHENESYFAYVLTGLVIWNFISSSIIKGTSSLIASGGYLKEIKLSFSLFLLKALIKNSIIFLHALVIVFLYLLISSKGVSLTFLLVIPYFMLLILALFFWCLFASMLVVYCRDLLHMLPRLLNFLFLMTPIVWQNKIVGDKYQIIVQLNPMTTLVNIIREPLLGTVPSLHDFLVTLTIVVVGFFLSTAAYQWTKNKLIFLI